MRGLIRTVAGASAVCGLLAFPASGSAAESVGQVGGADQCTQNTTNVQEGVAANPSYTATTSGVITSFATLARGTNFQTSMKLLVVEVNTTNHSHTVVAKDTQARTNTMASTTNVFSGLHVPISAGQSIGLYVPNMQPNNFGACLRQTLSAADDWGYQSMESDPFQFHNIGDMERLNLSAVIEPDADGDRFGDETQDQCPTSAAAQGACPVPTVLAPLPITPVAKKCKKGRKLRRGKCVKKRKK